jgi:hypothetical protein
MLQNEIINEIEKLPPEAQQQVKDYILFLQSRYKTSPPLNREKTRKLADEPFIGIWKDREDMKDSRTWVRNIRKSEWRTPDA